MDKVLALVLLIIGSVLIVGREKISKAVFRQQVAHLKLVVGGDFDRKSSKILTFFKWLLVIIGIFLLLMAYAIVFGPIRI